jgi:hypothetical protein
MDAFLEEQLRRIQELTRRITSVERRSAELSREIENDRQRLRQGPLHEVRDFRTYSRREHSSRRDRATINETPRRSHSKPRRKRR